MKLHIGRSFSLGRADGPSVDWPVDAVTETFGIFGMRGSGKSTTAKVFVEELTKAGQQVVIIDPLGVFYGLKSSADGKSEGLPFTVIGGPHSDIPINDRAGALVADLVIETTNPLILDLSQMRKAEQRRFVAAFLDQLWHRANGSKIIHVVVDECDLFAPQHPIKGAEALLGSMEDLVRRGRGKGLGSTNISQRPASVHTDIRSQVSVLIAHRLAGTHDRAALDVWVEAHGDKERRAEMMRNVAALPTGVAWMWSPQFLELFAEVAVRLPDTFDSSATPKPGQRQIVPKRLAKADVKALTAKMASIIAEAEQTDVKALQRRIRELEGEVQKLIKLGRKEQEDHAVTQARYEAVNAQLESRTVEPDLDPALRNLSIALEEATSNLWAEIEDAVANAKRSPEGKRGGSRSQVAPVVRAERETARTTPPSRAKSFTSTDLSGPKIAKTIGQVKTDVYVEQNGDVTGPMRKLLIVLATHGPRTKRQLALQAGYAENGGAFANPLGKLRSMGYVTKGVPIEITVQGKEALGEYEALPTGQALIDHWMSSNAMSGPMAKILTALIDAWDKRTVHSRDSLAEECGYSPNGGAFANPLGKLRTLGLVSKGPEITLTDEFGDAIS